MALVVGLGLSAILLTVEELHLRGGAGLALRALVVAALSAGLGFAAWRLRTRVEMVEGIRRGQDAMGEGILLIEPATFQVVHANPAAAAIFARPLDVLIGLDVRELALPADRPIIEERRRLQAAGHKVPERVALQIAHAGPDARFAEWATVPLTVERHALLLTTARDITAREQTKQRLIDEHAFLEAVLDTAGPIVVLSPDGRLLRVNAATARLAGMERAQMLGRTPWQLGLMSVDEGAHAGAALRAGDDPQRHCVSWHTRERERIVMWSATAMRDGDGRIRSVVALGLDLTELRAAEDRARRAHAALDLRSHELERSNRDLVQFAELASRDLREPVRAIAGFTDLLAAHPGLDARGRSYVAAVRDAAAGMDELLDRLAAYGRLGRGEALASDVDCERTVDAVLGELAEEIDARVASVTRDPLPVVPGDPEELAALFSNLISNALRFGGEHGPAVHIGARRRDLGWQLTVSDNGAGVPRAERQRIFQIFRRAPARGPHRGVGVGLALCQRIVERHGGAIWVDDVDGGGSAFHVTLPDREAR